MELKLSAVVTVPLNDFHGYGMGRSKSITSWRELDLEIQTYLDLNSGSSTF